MVVYTASVLRISGVGFRFCSTRPPDCLLAPSSIGNNRLLHPGNDVLSIASRSNCKSRLCFGTGRYRTSWQSKPDPQASVSDLIHS